MAFAFVVPGGRGGGEGGRIFLRVSPSILGRVIYTQPKVTLRDFPCEETDSTSAKRECQASDWRRSARDHGKENFDRRRAYRLQSFLPSLRANFHREKDVCVRGSP